MGMLSLSLNNKYNIGANGYISRAIADFKSFKEEGGHSAKLAQEAISAYIMYLISKKEEEIEHKVLYSFMHMYARVCVTYGGYNKEDKYEIDNISVKSLDAKHENGAKVVEETEILNNSIYIEEDLIHLADAIVTYKEIRHKILVVEAIDIRHIILSIYNANYKNKAINKKLNETIRRLALKYKDLEELFITLSNVNMLYMFIQKIK